MVRGGLNEASKDSPQESLCCFGGESTVAWWLIRRAEAKRENLGRGSQRIANDIYLDQTEGAPSNTPKFRVELRNAGQNDLVVNLGMMLANGKRQYPNAVALTLTDAQGKSRRLDLREPAMIAGRVDPFVVPIPVGATFSIPVNLDGYWPAASKEFDYKLKPGTYSLEAQFTGRSVSQQEANLDVKGIALMPYWTETVTSNQLRFEVSSQ
jgi:hypothetical protein